MQSCFKILTFPQRPTDLSQDSEVAWRRSVSREEELWTLLLGPPGVGNRGNRVQGGPALIPSPPALLIAKPPICSRSQAVGKWPESKQRHSHHSPKLGSDSGPPWHSGEVSQGLEAWFGLIWKRLGVTCQTTPPSPQELVDAPFLSSSCLTLSFWAALLSVRGI